MRLIWKKCKKYSNTKWKKAIIIKNKPKINIVNVNSGRDFAKLKNLK